MSEYYFKGNGEGEPNTPAPASEEKPVGSTYPPVDTDNIPVDDDTTDQGHRGYENFGQ